MNKKIKIVGVALAGIGLILVGLYSQLNTKTPVANAQSSPLVPTVNITFDGRGASIYLSSSGPFKDDFALKVCFNNGRAQGQPGPDWGASLMCVTSPMASQAALFVLDTSGATGAWSDGSKGGLSNWHWPGYKDGLTGNVTADIVNVTPLPPGEIVTNVYMGIGLGEDNAGQLTAGNTWVPCQFMPEWGGGWSGTVYGHTYGNCSSGNSNTPDDFQVGFSALHNTFGATAGSNNLPTSYTVSENKTLGTDNNPLQISVTNTGDTPWAMYNNYTTLSQTGDCDDPGYGASCPDTTTRPQGSSCTQTGYNWSSVFSLKHISGSFGVGTDPYHSRVSHIPQRARSGR